MKNLYANVVATLLGLCCMNANAQVDTIDYNAGIWQYAGTTLSKTDHPIINGRLSNLRWADIEPSPNVWNWEELDSDFNSRAADSLPFIFMIYTKEDAPDWIFSNGVPKVIETDNLGNVTGYSPYYADADYKTYFKRMITAVSQHVKTLPANVRKQIIAVQGCYGSTGDYISYKGNVPSQYALSTTDFFNLFKEFSQYYYDEYKQTNPGIRLLSNPPNAGDDQYLWLTQSCPGSWFKNGTIGKGYQLNDEKTKAGWLYTIMNSPLNGNYIRTRSEITGSGLVSPWWNNAPYKNMFALMSYGIYWGLDWSNQGYDQITDPLFDSAFSFYNKYAGQKDPAKSTGAVCILKDVIDAADVNRFPVSTYGPAERTTTRLQNVLKPFVPYGAKLEDPATAILDEYSNLSAKGTNDVGWDLFEGNYDRYLHQIDANTTSVGYWNVESSDPNTMYGKYARGFDAANGKNALYFDVDDAFLNYSALDAAYPVMVEITYLDKGTGSWQLFYDAKGNSNKSSISVTCANTLKWKKVSVTLTDAYFGNKGTNTSDFYIKNINSNNALFSVVELNRSGAASSGSSLFYSGPVSFDTVCVNSTVAAKQFSVSGQFLNNTPVTIGPLEGYTFSTTSDGTYSSTIVLSNYGASLAQVIYTKLTPAKAGSYSGNIPLSGGGASMTNIAVTAYAANGNPDLSSTIVKNVSCYNAKNGSIDLQTTGGAGPFTYSWVNNTNNFKSTAQDISSLIPSTYTVTINANYGCKSTASFVISQPDVLNVTVSSDPMTCKGSTTKLYVKATGGTTPYNGTGTFTVGPGFNTYTVTDENGCTDHQGYSVTNGTLTAPAKPTAITGATADATGVCGAGNFSFAISSVANATSYTWTAPANSSVASTSNGGKNMVLKTNTGFNGGTLSVTANNTCGASKAETKALSTTPDRPGTVTGPSTVKSLQSGLTYSIPTVAGVKYTWVVPYQATIVSGQNTGTVKVTWGSKDGYIKVRAENDCSNSYYSKLYVTVTGASILGNMLSGQLMSAIPDTMIVYPNPAVDMAYVSFKSPKSAKYTIEIKDITGRMVLSQTLTSNPGLNRAGFDVHLLPKGMYMVTIYNDIKGKIRTMKLVKG